MKKLMIVIFFAFSFTNLFGLHIESKFRNEYYYNHYRRGLINFNDLIVTQNKLTNNDYYYSQFFKLQSDILSYRWEIDLLLSEEYKKQKWQDDIAVKELFFQKSVTQDIDIKVGRFIHQWGTGYAYNPTNFVAPSKDISDLNNKKNQLTGKEGIALEYFGVSYSFSLCYFTSIRNDFEFEENKFAFRFYKNINNLDISLLTLMEENRNPSLGANFSSVVGDRLEVHGEISGQQGSYRSMHEILCNDVRNQLFTHFPFIDYNRDSKKIYKKYVLGFQYTISKRAMIVFEYYHQDEGYSKNEWKRITNYLDYVKQRMTGYEEPLAAANLLWNMNIFSPKGSMSDYMMNYFNIEVSQYFDLTNIVLLNILDLSYVCIPEVEFRFKHRIKTFAKFFMALGKHDTEFGGVYQNFRGEMGLVLYF